MALRIVQSIFMLGLLLPTAQAQQAVTFATNWKAQAAHGGFYQAVADGTYKKYGLEVTIRQVVLKSITGRCCRHDVLISS